MTVLGPVAPEEFGFTSMHEHIMLDMSVWMRNYGAHIPDYIPVSCEDPVSLENIGFLLSTASVTASGR
jgi:phosphotriesterase-related protein